MSAIKCATCRYLGESRLATIHCHRCYKELEDENKKMRDGLLEILDQIPPNPKLPLTLIIKTITHRLLKRDK